MTSVHQGHVADTHAIVWHFRRDPRLSAPARAVFQRADRGEQWIYVGAITLVELVYLVERGSLDAPIVERVFTLMEIPSGSYAPVGIGPGIARAPRRVPREKVPDMPDRIIVATALHRSLPLISKDERIRQAGVVSVVW